MNIKGRIPTWYPDEDAGASQTGDDAPGEAIEIPEELVEFLERAIDFISAFPILLIALVFWILPRLFGGRSAQRQADAESREIEREQQQPAGQPTPMTLEDLFRGEGMASSPRPRARTRGADDDEGIHFGSAYGNEYGKTKFGFDDSEWGSSFGEKKDSDPIIR